MTDSGTEEPTEEPTESDLQSGLNHVKEKRQKKCFDAITEILREHRCDIQAKPVIRNGGLFAEYYLVAKDLNS